MAQLVPPENMAPTTLWEQDQYHKYYEQAFTLRDFISRALISVLDALQGRDCDFCRTFVQQLVNPLRGWSLADGTEWVGMSPQSRDFPLLDRAILDALRFLQFNGCSFGRSFFSLLIGSLNVCLTNLGLFSGSRAAFPVYRNGDFVGYVPPLQKARTMHQLFCPLERICPDTGAILHSGIKQQILWLRFQLLCLDAQTTTQINRTAQRLATYLCLPKPANTNENEVACLLNACLRHLLLGLSPMPVPDVVNVDATVYQECVQIARALPKKWRVGAGRIMQSTDCMLCFLLANASNYPRKDLIEIWNTLDELVRIIAGVVI
jgi:hypothetical protein